MLYAALASVIFFGFIIMEVILAVKFRNDQIRKKENLSFRLGTLKKEEESLENKVNSLEKKAGEYFFFYELARKLAHPLDKKELFGVFSDEIKYLGEVTDIKCAPSGDRQYLEFRVGKEPLDVLSVKTQSQRVLEFLPHLAKLLELCIERIVLYGQLQELSIHDALTDTYNRRYFMQRYLEEFERAKKFSLNISFLMVDTDHFKKINDSYGHLVGDAVLKEVANLITANIREIDFVGRFGGEEFALILPETDKAGAVLVAERLCSVISRERFKAFDEILTTTISIGVASYPQNTLYSDMLIEVVDKALYKAKIQGRNRAAWF